jgi:hypothetical protein
MYHVEHPAEVGEPKRQLNHRRGELVPVVGVDGEASDVFVGLSVATKYDSLDALKDEEKFAEQLPLLGVHVEGERYRRGRPALSRRPEVSTL